MINKRKSKFFFILIKTKNVEKHFYRAKILEHLAQKSSSHFRAGEYTNTNDLRSQKILYNIFLSRYNSSSI